MCSILNFLPAIISTTGHHSLCVSFYFHILFLHPTVPITSTNIPYTHPPTHPSNRPVGWGSHITARPSAHTLVVAAHSHTYNSSHVFFSFSFFISLSLSFIRAIHSLYLSHSHSLCTSNCVMHQLLVPWVSNKTFYIHHLPRLLLHTPPHPTHYIYDRFISCVWWEEWFILFPHISLCIPIFFWFSFYSFTIQTFLVLTLTVCC